MRKSLLSPMILLLVLTLSGCETIRAAQQIKIPDFSIIKPTRPELVEIPTDTSAALKAMAINMSKMDGYFRQLEMFVECQKSMYDSILVIN
ncbi:MAG: hypothetical protein WDA14_03350 [Sphaerochaetaceae bacterium]